MVLRIAAWTEVVSLTVLLVNLATVHLPAVASLMGPVHGCAYLVLLGAVVRETGDLRTRLLAALPAVGGPMAVRRIEKARNWVA